jgi:ribosomal protein S18 acetylase RimI-like enzyme
MIAVQQAHRPDVKELAHVLGRAFFDDPVMNWILPDAGRRAKGLPILFAALARRQYLAGGGTELATEGATVAAAALWAPPGRWKATRSADMWMMPAFLRVFGSESARGRQVARLMKRHHPADPHWYLAVIGSDPTYRAQGYGHALMSSRLDRLDAERTAAYLESSDAANVPYYERFGFEVTGEIELPGGGPTMWPMWREPR